jgi:enoyl-[acyl-carrier protein] reductase II
MGFIAHERLVAAVSNVGGLGILGASPAPSESLSVMVANLRRLTDQPWGVGLIYAQTAFGPASTEAHIDVCVELRVPLVVFHHDLPPADWVRRLAASGTKVWMQVSSVELATAALELGVDGLVAQGREAGGHARAVLPVSELLSRTRGCFGNALILAAGGISEGTAVAAALEAGADGVLVGTRLVASQEAYAHREYKDRMVRSTGATIRTKAFGPEWPDQAYRILATPLAQSVTRPDQAVTSEPIGHTRLFPHSVNQAYDMPPFSNLPPTLDTSGDWDSMAFPAGEGVAAVRAILPAAEIVLEMMTEAQHAMSSSRPCATGG